MNGATRLTILLAVTASPLAACHRDECDNGDRECDGNVAATCYSYTDTEFSSHTEWTRIDCGDSICRTPPRGLGGGAFCALDKEPDPACPAELRDAGGVSRCVDGAVVTWTFGYRVAVTKCADGASCVDRFSGGFGDGGDCETVAFCSGLSAPDPLCRPGVATACADDTTIFWCQCGYRTNAHACSNPGPKCVPLDPGGGGPMQGACR